MSGLDDQILRYLAEQERRRDIRTGLAWATLTEREQGLVEDAAVMGFVRGAIFGNLQRGPRAVDGFPGDGEIVAEVLECVDSTSEKFVMLAAAFSGQRPETKAQALALQRGEDIEEDTAERCPTCGSRMIRIRADEDNYPWRCERCRENWPGGL